METVASTCTPHPLAPEGHCATRTPIVHVITGADPGAGDDIDPEPKGQAPVALVAPAVPAAPAAPAAPALAPHRMGAAWACVAKPVLPVAAVTALHAAGRAALADATEATRLGATARGLHGVRFMSFSGGGSRGMGHIGALRALINHGFVDSSCIEGCIGTSAGALAALFVTLGLPFDAICDMCSSAPSLLGSLDAARLVNTFGLDDGQQARRVLASFLAAGGLAPTSTFADLHRLTLRRFACVATNLATCRHEVFDVTRTPDMPLVEALLASICLPGVWAPVVWQGVMYVDGGVSKNIPPPYFAADETLVFVVEDVLTEVPASNPIDLMSFLHRVGMSGPSAQLDDERARALERGLGHLFLLLPIKAPLLRKWSDYVALDWAVVGPGERAALRHLYPAVGPALGALCAALVTAGQRVLP
jgi:predicted acylesterase/phospholipase RssA